MRSPLLLAFALGLGLLAACGGKTSDGASSSGGGGGGGPSGGAACYDADPSRYDTSCDRASDCFGYHAGDICGGTCACADHAANVSSQSAYNDGLAGVALADCFCPDAVPTCVDHQCTMPGATVGGGGDDSDAGGLCVDVDLSTYDSSCQTANDCADITSGTICSDSCMCGGSAINNAGLSRYQSTIAPLGSSAACPCPYFGAPACVRGQCAICGGPSTTEGCPDAG